MKLTNQKKRNLAEENLCSCWECGGRGMFDVLFAESGVRTAVKCEECDAVTRYAKTWQVAVVDWLIGDVRNNEGGAA